MATHPMPPGSWSDIENNPLLDEDAFQNEQSRGLFDAIDKLRSSGASQDIALPELVIVGDQSAGKSSLLQSLTDIPFPVASNVCTRFPTRIISRRVPGRRETTTVSIEPKNLDKALGNENWESRRVRLAAFEAFKRSFSTMTKADFIKAIDDAAEAMGIGGSTRNETITTSLPQTEEINFSDDVLKVEISGPDRSHFSILDVPGIFHSVTRSLTEKDKNGVNRIVNSYMRSQQSIIICVANGTNDLGPQAIFGMVERLDKDGARTLERTVGVITKCDTTQRVVQVLETAKNIEKPLRHGWFVVRNRTPFEVDQGVGPLERFQKEQDFFSRFPWSGLPKERRGTQALKKYLAELLCTHIEQTFPTLLKTIQANRDRTASDLQNLGTGRITIEQKRAYLTRIAHNFNSLATQGLRGRYDGLIGNNMKLRMKIRDANDHFVQEMIKNGHFLPFVEQTTGENKNTSALVSPSSGLGSSAATSTSLQPQNSSGGFALGSPWETKASSGGFGFGTTSDVSNVRIFCPGTTNCQFVEHKEKDDSRTGSGFSYYQSINFLALYRCYSFEELRLSDYLQAQSSTLTPEKSSTMFPNPIGQSSAQLKKGPFLFPALDGAQSNPFQVSNSGVFGHTLPTELTEIYEWIRDEIKASRGTELQGTINPDVLPILFHKQARKWRSISKLHFEKAATVASKVVCDILKSECIDSHTRAIIETLIDKANKHSRDRFQAHLSRRVDDILSRHLQTNNPAFEQKVSEARKKRFHAALERYKKAKNCWATPVNQGASPFGGSSNKATSPADDNQLVIDMRDTGLLFAELHMSNMRNLEDEVHDTLKAYYEIARDDFVEYVNQLIVEPYLNDPKGPVLFFSPVYVAGLKDEEIEALAMEDEKTVRDRKTLEETLARLDQAEKIAQEYEKPGR